VGTATSAEALRQVAEQRPDVVLVDINLGEENGFELARMLVDRFSQLASGVVLMLDSRRAGFRRADQGKRGRGLCP